MDSSADHAWAFEGSTTLIESGILFPLLGGIQVFLDEIGLFSFFLCLHLHYKDAYVAYHMSHDAEGNDADYIRWISCVHSSSTVLDV